MIHWMLPGLQLLVMWINLLPYRDNNNISAQKGKASYYGHEFEGRRTASGERFTNADYTAAHRSLPFNSFVKTTNLKNNLSIIVRINDRGPYVRTRIIDLSEAAARRIGSYQHGLASVKIEVMNIIQHNPELDSLFSCEDVLDCLGNPDRLQGYSLSLWRTTDLIHMLYVANELYINENVDKVLILGSGINEKRMFHLVITGYHSKKEALENVDYFERKGFMKPLLLK